MVQLSVYGLSLLLATVVGYNVYDAHRDGFLEDGGESLSPESLSMPIFDNGLSDPVTVKAPNSPFHAFGSAFPLLSTVFISQGTPNTIGGVWNKLPVLTNSFNVQYDMVLVPSYESPIPDGLATSFTLWYSTQVLSANITSPYEYWSQPGAALEPADSESGHLKHSGIGLTVKFTSQGNDWIPTLTLFDHMGKQVKSMESDWFNEHKKELKLFREKQNRSENEPIPNVNFELQYTPGKVVASLNNSTFLSLETPVATNGYIGVTHSSYNKELPQERPSLNLIELEGIRTTYTHLTGQDTTKFMRDDDPLSVAVSSVFSKPNINQDDLRLIRSQTKDYIIANMNRAVAINTEHANRIFQLSRSLQTFEDELIKKIAVLKAKTETPDTGNKSDTLKNMDATMEKFQAVIQKQMEEKGKHIHEISSHLEGMEEHHKRHSKAANAIDDLVRGPRGESGVQRNILKMAFQLLALLTGMFCCLAIVAGCLRSKLLYFESRAFI